jgi:hypothetical protein
MLVHAPTRSPTDRRPCRARGCSMRMLATNATLLQPLRFILDNGPNIVIRHANALLEGALFAWELSAPFPALRTATFGRP